jgi:hypothetical protein
MTAKERAQFEQDLKDVNVRKFHADSLNRIFRGTIGIITESQITPEIAKASQFLEAEVLRNQRIMKIVLYGIQAATVGLFTLRLIKLVADTAYYGSIYAAVIRENAWSSLASAAMTAEYDTIFLSAYNKNALVKACIDKVNVNWKSQMGLLLSGIIDELPY